MRTLLTLLFATGLLAAAPTQEIASSKLIPCLTSKEGLASLDTKSGVTVRGLLEPVAGDELSIRDGTGVVKVKSSDVLVARLYAEVPAKRLKNWRRHYRESARRSAGWIFSERALLGFVHARWET